MAEEVKYTLTLNDLLSGKLNAANNAAKGLESTIKKILSAYGAFNFLKGSVEMFNESAQASAQLDASLRSTANAANLNREALDAQAEALMNISLFDDDAITKSQSLLATFTNIKDVIFMDAIPAITDMATKMGGDLQGATIQVGKALNDPIKGITALSRVGVSFSESQVEVIKNLVETNRTAEAQVLILKELQVEFGGSAEAASKAGAGPLTVLKNKFNNIREELGELIVDIGKDLMPTLKMLMQRFSDLVKWIKENKEMLGQLIVALGSAWVAFKLIGGAVAIWQAISAAIKVAALATEGLAASSVAFISTIGLLAVAVGALVAVYIQLKQAMSAVEDAQNESFNSVRKNSASQLQQDLEQYKKNGLSDKEAFNSSVKTEEDFLKKQRARLEDDYKKRTAIYEQYREKGLKEGYSEDDLKKYGPYKDLEDARYNMRMQESREAGLNDFKNNQMALGGKKSAIVGSTKLSSSGSKADKVTGSKVVSINIQIGNLVNEFKVMTTNVTESATKIKEHVAAALISAVNDSQIVATN